MQTCKTVEGNPCVFPFNYRGKEVTKCITGPKRRQPWCPTQVDDNGSPIRGEWGVCNTQCPTEWSEIGKLSLKESKNE